GCDLKRLIPGSLFEGSGDDVNVFFIAIGDCVAETIVGHVINRVLKILAVLAIGGDDKDISSRSDGVRRLHVESYLNVPTFQYPRVRIGRFALGVNDAEVVLVEERQARQLEVGIRILLDGGITVALHQNDRLAGAIESLFVNRVEAISRLQLLRQIGAGYTVLFVDGAGIDRFWRNISELQGNSLRREETLGGNKSGWKSGLVGEPAKRQWSVGFSSAHVNSTRIERTHLMAFQTGYGGDIVPRLTAEPRVLDVGAVDPAVVSELVEFGVESALDVGDGATGADGEADGIRGKNGKS